MAISGGSSNSYDLNSVLTKVSHIELFKYYTGGIEPEELTYSPLRNDDANPSFVYGQTDHGIKFKDFGTGKKGSIIDFLKIKFDCTLQEAVNIIATDFKLDKSRKKYGGEVIGRTTPRKVKIIQIRASNWNPFYLQYWYDYGISKSTLEYFNVIPITHYWISGVQHASDHAYAYRIFDRYKILNLKGDKTSKWRTNCDGTYWQGAEQLPKKGDVLFITSSLKDVMVLYELGYNGIAPQSETNTIPENILTKLKHRFKMIIVLYDNDQTGIDNAKELQDKYGFQSFFVPEEKDPSDYVKKHNLLKLKEIIAEFLWQTDQS